MPSEFEKWCVCEIRKLPKEFEIRRDFNIKDRRKGWFAALKWRLSRFPNKLGSYDLRRLKMEIEKELREVENESTQRIL